ncbi:hypothetical protein [Arenimonas daejeonensis]|uniref:hypothetical protein n=1 Tax=Arenimonas daejeonensis TaxID=370777 RepID=UPI0011BD54B1|nr:hypothetical protein [Arenimonas daejeonensis]
MQIATAATSAHRCRRRRGRDWNTSIAIATQARLAAIIVFDRVTATQGGATSRSTSITKLQGSRKVLDTHQFMLSR